ncbi:Baculoviral IAP repeat-containing protein [Tieghemostelium lacteum]|uniref:Baculoviral IAP repeat-containing protein n=1 Tax=Tieghemostelium lacteum TaxID=361077 RepID=A0A151ZFA9_TIELA|nr:Baculoviral IAP repeat-containing protein [Tieghemostelium lacteum]|eukprot:KYQ92653.1 Baculoviral IAP repeat-containing protein [Tieghemostelium lacteum]
MAGNLEKVFEKWQSSQKEPDEYIWLQSSKNTVELLFRGHEININFPTDITDYKSYTLSSKDKANELWISKLNNEIASNVQSSFVDILNLALDFYKRRNDLVEKPKVVEKDEEDEEEEEQDDINEDEEDEVVEEYPDEDEEMDMDDEDDQFENDHFQEALQTLKLKKVWAKKDKEIRAKLGEKKKDQKVKSIFSSDAAFGVLTNDIFNIMQNVQSLGFSANPIDDNIYHWNVRIFGFQPDSKIYSQLQQIKKEYNYDYIEIQALFTEDLYPFYPPTIKVIRPRLQGFFLGRISHLELLKLENWNPVCDMKYVLNHLKEILEKFGQLDVNNPMNSLNNSAGSYSTLEHFLLRLEILSDTPPRANLKYGLESTIVKPKGNSSAITNPFVVQDNKTVVQPQYGYKDNKTYWAKGTGYGRGGQSGWNVDAFLAAQKERDNEIIGLLNAVESEVAKNSIPVDILEESCLVPFIESYCRDISLLDVERHADLWTSILKLMETMSSNENYFILFTQLSFQTKSLGDYIKDVSIEIELVMKRLDDATKKGLVLQNTILRVNNLIQSKLKKMNDEIRQLENQAKSISNSSNNNNTTKKQGASDEEMYIRTLKNLIFDACTLKGITKPGYTSTQARTLRIAQEQGTLIKSLPLNYESSVFARVDDKSIDIMQVLITGPKDTPYSGGCFLFNVVFSQTYPQAPPSVLIMTTGGGSVRFNPNLYNTGKVCLSLLGTWSGGAGENWNPQTSTLLQVLVSIQSLILVPEPFFNEPGYESQMGTPQGKQSSFAYNQNIRVATMEWAMVDMLKNPPEPFKEVVQTHFYYSREKLKNQCAEWVEESKSSKEYYAKILKAYNNLIIELDKLVPPAL